MCEMLGQETLFLPHPLSGRDGVYMVLLRTGDARMSLGRKGRLGWEEGAAQAAVSHASPRVCQWDPPGAETAPKKLLAHGGGKQGTEGASRWGCRFSEVCRRDGNRVWGPDRTDDDWKCPAQVERPGAWSREGFQQEAGEGRGCIRAVRKDTGWKSGAAPGRPGGHPEGFP